MIAVVRGGSPISISETRVANDNKLGSTNPPPSSRTLPDVSRGKNVHHAPRSFASSPQAADADASLMTEIPEPVVARKLRSGGKSFIARYRSAPHAIVVS